MNTNVCVASYRPFFLIRVCRGSFRNVRSQARLKLFVLCKVQLQVYLRETRVDTDCLHVSRFVIEFIRMHLTLCGPDSSVGIATGYGLDGPGIESRWGRDFLRLSRPAVGLTQPPVQWVPGISRG